MAFDIKTTPLPWLKDRIIFLTHAGSRAYGTSIPGSDQDLRGVAIPPVSYFMGLNKFDQWYSKQVDCVIFSLHKFLTMAMAANPNIIELLYTDPADHITVTPIGVKLLRHRDLFLTKRAFGTFRGYAVSQLQKLKNQAGHGTKVRQALIEAHGYDTKHAMHLIRLLRMGTEMMQGKGVLVKRPDAAELVGIRNGSLTLDQVMTCATDMDAALVEAAKKSKLPDEPDAQKVNDLCVALTQESFAHSIQMPIMATGWASHPITFGLGELQTKKLTKDEEPDTEKKE